MPIRRRHILVALAVVGALVVWTGLWVVGFSTLPSDESVPDERTATHSAPELIVPGGTFGGVWYSIDTTAAVFYYDVGANADQVWNAYVAYLRQSRSWS